VNGNNIGYPAGVKASKNSCIFYKEVALPGNAIKLGGMSFHVRAQYAQRSIINDLFTVICLMLRGIFFAKVCGDTNLYRVSSGT